MAELDKRALVSEKTNSEFDELLQDVNSLLEDGECSGTRLSGLEEGECTPTRIDLDDSFDFDLDFNDGDDENSENEITGRATRATSLVGCSELEHQGRLHDMISRVLLDKGSDAVYATSGWKY